MFFKPFTRVLKQRVKRSHPVRPRRARRPSGPRRTLQVHPHRFVSTRWSISLRRSASAWPSGSGCPAPVSVQACAQSSDQCGSSRASDRRSSPSPPRERVGSKTRRGEVRAVRRRVGREDGAVELFVRVPQPRRAFVVQVGQRAPFEARVFRRRGHDRRMADQRPGAARIADVPRHVGEVVQLVDGPRERFDPLGRIEPAFALFVQHAGRFADSQVRRMLRRFLPRSPRQRERLDASPGCDSRCWIDSRSPLATLLGSRV